jgi:excisionase family DNA binding protein
VSGLDDAMRALIRETFRDEIRIEVARQLAERETPTEFLSTRHAAEHADVAEGTIRRWIREQKLEGHRAGRHVRVKRADLDALMRVQRAERELSPEEWARREFGR